MQIIVHMKNRVLPMVWKLILQKLIDPRLIYPEAEIGLTHHLCRHCTLVVHVNGQHAFTRISEASRNVGRESALTHPTFLRGHEQNGNTVAESCLVVRES